MTTFGPSGPGWGGGDGERRFYTADEGEIVLAHEGELELEQRSDESMSDIDLGGGIHLRIHPDYFRMIMHTPEITAQVDARCEDLASEANTLAIRDGAEYVYQVSNNPDNIRARGRVKPGNIEAVLDDDENATLLKALSTVGSDPLPPSYFAGNEAYERYLDSHEEYFSGLAPAEPTPIQEGPEGRGYPGAGEGE